MAPFKRRGSSGILGQVAPMGPASNIPGNPMTPPMQPSSGPYRRPGSSGVLGQSMPQPPMQGPGINEADRAARMGSMQSASDYLRQTSGMGPPPMRSGGFAGGTGWTGSNPAIPKMLPPQSGLLRLMKLLGGQ